MAPGPRSKVLGPIAGALLVVATCISAALGLLPGAPLLDGLAPPPAYRWVDPPPELRGSNQTPAALGASVTLTASGSQAADLATGDEQVQLELPAGAFPPAPEQVALSVTVQPLDPAGLPPPPAGIAIQGNAYRIAVTYVPSGATATAVQPVDVILRYPVDATRVILLAGGQWQFLAATLQSAALSIAATTRELGVFAAADAAGSSRPARTPGWAYAAAGLALLAAAVPTLLRRKRNGARPGRAARTRRG
jgi:hypothetical protein